MAVVGLVLVVLRYVSSTVGITIGNDSGITMSLMDLRVGCSWFIFINNLPSMRNFWEISLTMWGVFSYFLKSFDPKVTNVWSFLTVFVIWSTLILFTTSSKNFLSASAVDGVTRYAWVLILLEISVSSVWAIFSVSVQLSPQKTHNNEDKV